MALAAAALGACAAPPQVRTTFLGSVDLVNMTDRMAESMATDDVISARGPDDDPWVFSIYRVVNRTNQVIPDREKWAYVGRLRAQLQQSRFAREHSIIWVIPPERWPIVAEALGDADVPPELRMTPTHQVTAEFHALTATSGAGRSDAYLCDWQLIDLDFGTIVWEDAWEVKRAVTGRTYD